MTTSRQDSRTVTVFTNGLAVMLLPGIVINRTDAFVMPGSCIPISSLKFNRVSTYCDDRMRYKPVFSVQNFNADQWGDDDYDYSYYDDYTYFNNQKKKEIEEFCGSNYFVEKSKRAIISGAAVGTLLAINSADLSAVAENVVVPIQQNEAPAAVKSVPVISSSKSTEQPAVLPYLERQIKAAEDAINTSETVTTVASANPINVAATKSGATSVTPTKYDMTPTDALTSAPIPPKATSVTASAVANTSVKNVFSNKAVATAAAVDAARNTSRSAPSLYLYTQDHIPGWIETGQKVYKTVEPKVVAGGRKLILEVDKRVTPNIIEKEHQVLGDANSAILDDTLSTVVKGGRMIAGMVRKVISFGVEGGKFFVKTTPEVISVGKQIYKTIDEKILPEVIDTSHRMKSILDETVPEVVDTGKHAYDTIMPEVVNAEKQIASTMKGGINIAMPIVKQIENKIVPELNQIELAALSKEQAAMLDKSVAEVAQQGQYFALNVQNTIPQVFSAGIQTADSIATTGRTVAKTVPIMVETGKHVYGSVDRSFTDAVTTTRDIATDLDRAGGKAAYAIEGQIFGAAETIDKTLPVFLETGRQVAVTVPAIAKTVGTGSKAIVDDISGFVQDLKVQSSIDSATKRFAKSKPRTSKPMFRDFTASVNDPNRMGSL